MKILFVKSPRGAITGSSVYQDALLDAMAPDVAVTLYRGEEDLAGTWDAIHVLDGKHMPRALLSSSENRIFIDLHDHYWTRFVPFPAPDLPVRWWMQKKRARHMNRVLARADGVIVHSEAVKAAVRHPHVHNVGMGIRFPETASTPQARNDRILIVGRDLFRKGFTTVLAALRRIRSDLPSVELCVVGREYPHALLAARMLSIGLPVRFLGECSPARVAELYETSRAFVLASWTEALGITVIEAMAHRVPVIASSAGGIPEIVSHEQNGQLFSPGDDRMLADSLRRVWRDSGAVEAWADQGAVSVRENFSMRDMISRLIELYSAE